MNTVNIRGINLNKLLIGIVLICSLFLLHNTVMADMIPPNQLFNFLNGIDNSNTSASSAQLTPAAKAQVTSSWGGYTAPPTAPIINTTNQQTSPPPAPNNNNRVTGPNDSNPADRNKWAIDNGYTGWSNYQDTMRQQEESRRMQAEAALYEQKINSQIDATYGPTMDYLNQNVNYIGGQKTAAEQQAAADLAANQGTLGTNKEQTLGQLATQGRGVQTQKEDALAQARRLYGELSRGNVQRFGGATSAGQAASEIQGAEAQRQFGQVNRGANEAFQKIEQAKTDVESQYKSGLLQLQQTHQQGLAKIQNDFTNAIMQINNQRAATEQAKGQAKLAALQNLRQEALQLQSQATQFQQQLDLMREQANLNIQAYAKTSGAAYNTGVGAASTFGTQASSLNPYSTVGQGQLTQQTTPVGQIQNYYRPKDLFDTTGVTFDQ